MSEASADLRQVLGLLDLTRLEDNDTPDQIEALCRRAVTSHGTVAAVCIFPAFVTVARQTLGTLEGADSVRVATVANFPAGDSAPETVASQIGRSVVEGADEVDVVFPWSSFLQGDRGQAKSLLEAAREACGTSTLKVILETAALADAEVIRDAALVSIEAGADFLKTSTGKGPGGATPEAVTVLLEAIRDSDRDLGCKISGGVRRPDEALDYLALARKVMGLDWVSPAHLRFGASGLLDALIQTIDAHSDTASSRGVS